MSALLEDSEEIAGGIFEPRNVRAHIHLPAAHDALRITIGVVLKLNAASGELIHRYINVIHHEVQDGKRGRLVIVLGVRKDRPTSFDVVRASCAPGSA